MSNKIEKKRGRKTSPWGSLTEEVKVFLPENMKNDVDEKVTEFKISSRAEFIRSSIDYYIKNNYKNKENDKQNRKDKTLPLSEIYKRINGILDEISEIFNEAFDVEIINKEIINEFEKWYGKYHEVSRWGAIKATVKNIIQLMDDHDEKFENFEEFKKLKMDLFKLISVYKLEE
jgi:Arc/MetJ-type ribon-helix-helix transcriptional regulator